MEGVIPAVCGGDRPLVGRDLRPSGDDAGLEPFLWGFLAVVVYAGALVYGRGAGPRDAPWVWAGSFGGPFVLPIVPAVVAAIERPRDPEQGEDEG